MEKKYKHRKSNKNGLLALEADMRKAHLISNIREQAELGDEEENKGRS
ncbi:MAG TPA: hypothetical protein VEG39_13235 [Clostridia bacterium]|nr:hypothetical protein [Clostridia bacterium]